MDLQFIIEKLRIKRPIFHSEADFQFALAQEIQTEYPKAKIRLEYPPANEPNKYIDIFVINEDKAYPIELKYKTKKLTVIEKDERFNLKDQGAQDIGMYDFIKDICRLEKFATHIDNVDKGYVLWLTNDTKYWSHPQNSDAGYTQFSVHQGALKYGSMVWGSSTGIGTQKGRTEPLVLRNEYTIEWRNYCDLGIHYGQFKYAILSVE